MKSAPLFTILVPTFNHEQTLKYSLASIADQTIRDFQVLVIGDGASQKTAQIVKKIAARDHRFSYHPFLKSPRTGEPYRHQLLSVARSRYVCYLSDDDLWFPEHLENMVRMLKKHDFAYSFPVMITPDQQVTTWYGDLTQPFYKKMFLAKKNQRYNVIPLSCAGHTLAAYKKLSRGWETTPVGKHTDLHMWQAFVSQPWLRLKKYAFPTVIHFASSQRQDQTTRQRVAELAIWYQRLKQPAIKIEILGKALNSVYEDFLNFRAATHATKTWQLHDLLVRPLIKQK